MDVRRALQNALCTACLAASAIVSQPARAVEFGFGHYFLGLVIPMCGYVPPPGGYFWNSFLLFDGSRPAITTHFVVDIAQIGWFFDAGLFGATFGLVATAPFVGDKNSLPPSFAGGTIQSFGKTDSIASLGDLDFSAVLGWHSGNNNWSVVLTGFTPTGNFNPHRFVQTGLNRAAIDIKGAYTFYDLQTGNEVSGALGLTFNARNPATDYQSGIELHFEWAVAHHFPFNLVAGVGGYFYQQLSDDFGPGDLVGPFRGRVAAVGPLLSYTFKEGAQAVTLSGRWFHDFAVQNRVRGDAIFATLSFPL
jgi:hypothetical protein